MMNDSCRVMRCYESTTIASFVPSVLACPRSPLVVSILGLSRKVLGELTPVAIILLANIIPQASYDYIYLFCSREPGLTNILPS